MHIERLILGELRTNCYIVSETKDSDTALLIDPADDGWMIRNALHSRKVAGVFLTHGHFDHTAALKDFAACPIYIHEKDAPFLTDAYLGTGGDLAASYDPRPAPTHLLQDGDEITVEGFSLPVKVMHTPGHTPGCCVYCLGQDYFTGDTLFKHGYGRYDLPGGDLRQLMGSLRRLLKSPVDAAIYPGHGESSTLFQERGKA